MSISGIGSYTAAAATQYGGVSQVAGQSGDSGNASGGITAVGSGSQGGQLTSALMQALAQLGVSPTASSATDGGASSSTQDSVTSLIQNLAAALQSQGAAGGTAAGSSSGGATASSSQSTLETSLQNLIFQIGSSNASLLGSMFGSAGSGSATDSTGLTGSGSAGSASSALSSLQQNFEDLTSSQGTSNSQTTPTTLQSFLESTLQNIQGATSTGNLISTQA